MNNLIWVLIANMLFLNISFSQTKTWVTCTPYDEEDSKIYKVRQGFFYPGGEERFNSFLKTGLTNLEEDSVKNKYFSFSIKIDSLGKLISIEPTSGNKKYSLPILKHLQSITLWNGAEVYSKGNRKYLYYEDVIVLGILFDPKGVPKLADHFPKDNF